MRVVNWVLFFVGVLGLIIGAVVVHTTKMQEDQKGNHAALVQTGAMESVDAVVTEKRIREKTRTSSVKSGANRGGTRSSTTTTEYRILLQISDSESLGRTVNRSDYEAIQKGEIYNAYLIEGKYFIPRLDTQTHGYVKWMIFSICTIPMLGAIALFILRMAIAFRTRSQQAQPNASAI